MVRRRPLCLATLLALASVSALAAAGTTGRAQPSPPAAEPQPASIEPVVRRAQRWDGEPYRLYRWSIPLERSRLEVVDVGMRRGLSRWVREGASLVFNGGFYGTDSRPEGLVVSSGNELNAFLARIGGGIVSLSNHRAALHDAEAEPLDLPAAIDFAIQCRPRLVVDGANNIRRRTPATAARTALCIRDGGRGLDLYVARRDPSRGRAGPTLHTLGRQLVAEGCEQALNLDGGPSTGVAWRGRRGIRSLPPRRGIRHAVVVRVER